MNTLQRLQLDLKFHAVQGHQAMKTNLLLQKSHFILLGLSRLLRFLNLDQTVGLVVQLVLRGLPDQHQDKLLMEVLGRLVQEDEKMQIHKRHWYFIGSVAEVLSNVTFCIFIYMCT
jgi:hypothetical protein